LEVAGLRRVTMPGLPGGNPQDLIQSEALAGLFRQAQVG